MRDDAWRHGLELFNAGRFFDAHEALEDLWREAPRGSHRKRHLQGMVQLAVAFHHQSTGNYVGARSVLERALGNIEGAEASFPELDFKGLRASLTPWRKHLAGSRMDERTAHRPSSNASPPALPRILLHRREH
jgi:predicted metal-dependent hydrolase